MSHNISVMEEHTICQRNHTPRVIRARSHAHISLDSLEPVYGLFTTYEQLLSAVLVVSEVWVGDDGLQGDVE
jgi:hypothetical protein